MFKSVNIKNFRAITDLQLDNLKQVNLFVGQNNCGKTTLLEALFFLIGATNPTLPVNANTFRGLLPGMFGWSTFFHNLKIDCPVELTGNLRDIDEIQTLLLKPKKKDFVEQNIGATIKTKINSIDSGIKTEIIGLNMEYMSSKNPNEVAKMSVYTEGNTIKAEGHKDRPIKGVFLFSAVLSEFGSRFSNIVENKQDEMVVSLLKEVDPKISSLRLTGENILMVDIDLPRLIPIGLMGGGIIKVLSVATALLDYRDGIVLIDEIENGLHHSVQEKLWKAIFSWAEKLNIQVFATTHSYESVQAFTKCAKELLFGNQAKLYRIERKEDEFKSFDFETEELDRFIKNMWEMR